MARFRPPLRTVAVLPVITALLFSWVCHGVRLASPDTPHFGDGSFGHPAMPSTSGVVASWDACFVITAVPTADDWLPRLFSAPQPGWTGHDGPNPALHASTLRWMGGGSATSVRLNATTYAWVFSDSVIGEWLAGPPGIPGSRQRSGARIPHQTVSVMSGLHGDRQQPDRMRYYWKSQPSGAAVSMFSPDGQASSSSYFCDTFNTPNHLCDYVWITTGSRAVAYNFNTRPPTPEPGPLLLLGPRVSMMPQGTTRGGLSFDVLGTVAIAVDNPEAPPPLWTYRIANVSGTGPVANTGAGSVNWFVATARVRDPATPDLHMIMGTTDKYTVLARGNLTKLADTLDFNDLEFWVEAPHLSPGPTLPTNCGVVTFQTGAVRVSCWRLGLPANMDALTPVVPTPIAESTLAYSDTVGRWYMPVMDLFSGNQISLWTAPNATGPWEATRNVYAASVPAELQGQVWCNTAKAHSELAPVPGADYMELVVSYVCNALNVSTLFHDDAGQLFTPQFVTLNMSRVCTPTPSVITPAWLPSACDTRCAVVIVGIVAPCVLLSLCGVVVMRRRAQHLASRPAWEVSQGKLKLLGISQNSPSAQPYRRM